MTVTKIYYFDVDQGRFGDQELVRERDLYSDEFVFTICPVFNHKSNRTFVGFSPIDFTIKYNRTLDEVKIEVDDRELLHDESLHENHLKSPLPVVQLNFPKFLFWTEDSDIWFEYKDHPLTSLNNNFVGIGGWFNISNWPRMMSNAFTIVDETKEVVIKKGDPLFRVCFHPPNLDSGIILKKVTDPVKINEILELHTKRSGWKDKLFKKTEKQKTCPFKFLYDK